MTLYLISECTVNVKSTLLDIRSIQIRIVAVPVIKSDVADDREYRVLASLDDYLYSQNLDDKVPNLVLVQSNLNSTTGEASPEFHRILRALTLIGPKLVNESYSNVIFVVDNYLFLNPSMHRNPEKTFNLVEKTIANVYSIPKPIRILPGVSYETSEIVKHVKVNGNFRLFDREYFPKNFRDQIFILTEKGNDMFGYAVLRDWFDTTEFISADKRDVFMLPEGHFKVVLYRRLRPVGRLNGSMVNKPIEVFETTLSSLTEQHTRETQAKIEATTEKNLSGEENERSIWTYIGITIGITFPALLLVLLVVLWLRYNKLRNILTQDEVKQFLHGDAEEKHTKSIGKDDFEHGPVERHALSQPYNKSIEIAKTHFQILWSSLLGSGAFGCVYRAYIASPHNDETTEVALKMTKDNCPKTAVLNLLSEIKILTYLDHHPNLVSIKGAYTAEILNGVVYVATELCPLGSLKDYLREAEKAGNLDGRYSAGPDTVIESLTTVKIHEMVQWSYEIACGMEYLAEKHVVHADLATRNVLLNETKTAKITDFGLSRRLYKLLYKLCKNATRTTTLEMDGNRVVE